MKEKKSFSENPALQFINTGDEVREEVETPSAAPTRTPEPAPVYQRAYEPVYAPRPETKSKHFQMLIRPSLFQSLKNIADRRGLSVNELMNQILDEAVKNIDEY